MVSLTDREIEVARLCARGLTCKEIGKCLLLAPRTVEHHIERARQKCEAKNTAHFVAILFEEGILQPDAVRHEVLSMVIVDDPNINA
jgi:DNA-binding CsgD family transcriptional regulator